MRPLALGFVPLLDAAPLLVAKELGFAGQEGLDLSLHRAAGWSQLRDLLDLGQVEAAHMLSAMPIARALGLGGGRGRLDVLMVLSLNGQMVGLSNDLARAVGPVPFGDPDRAGAALAALGRSLRMGVPFPFSMHALLSRYWLDRAAPDLSLRLVTVPPPRMAEALEAGEIDLFCVGEPWGALAVRTAGAELILPGAAIWSQSPEKVLAVRHGWAEAEPTAARALLRALWRACVWADAAENRGTLAELLARSGWFDSEAANLEATLSGRVMARAQGDEFVAPGLIRFNAGLANFPWRSQAAWIGAEVGRAAGIDVTGSAIRARATFRSDLYRQHLATLGAALPRTSDRVEGALGADDSFPAVHGTLTLGRNRFFDGAIFDPSPYI